MDKKYYTFLIMIFILIILLYAIMSHKYKKYKISEHINSITKLNNEIKENIDKAWEIIEYKKSKAYKNKILKSDKALKNKWEKVVYITTEDKYNKYVKPIQETEIINKSKKKILDDTYWMTIYQKWIWFLFKEDIR